MLPRKSIALLRGNAIFRNFLLASTISLLGTGIFDIAMPLYVLNRTHSALLLSLVTVGLQLPYLLMAPLTGYLVDHSDNRRVMIFSDLGQVVCLLFLYIYEVTSARAIWPVLLTVFLAKSLMILFETVSTFQLVPALVEPEDLSTANTYFLGIQRTIQVFGPVSGGVLMGVLGVRSCILINLISFGATLFFSFRLKNLNELIEKEYGQVPKGELNPGQMMRLFRETLHYVWTSPLFKPFIVLMFFFNLSSLVPNAPTFTYYFTEQKHFSSASYGSIISLFGAMGVLGYLVSSEIYRRFEFSTALLGSALWQAVLGSASLFFVRSPLLLAVVFGLSRIPNAILTMGTFLLRQTRVPKSRMGSANSCIRMFFMLGAPVSALVQAVLIQRFGVEYSFVAGALCLWATWWYGRGVASAYQAQMQESGAAATRAA